MPELEPQTEPTPSAPEPQAPGPGGGHPSPLATDIAEAPAEKASLPPTPKRAVTAILIMRFGNTFAAMLPALVALPLIMEKIAPDNKEMALGIATGITAFGGMILAPLCGALSDRTTSRFGMRRPGLALGSAMASVGLVCLGLAGSLPAVYVALILLAGGQAMTNASHGAMTPDSIPEHTRGRVVGFESMLGLLAALIAGIMGPQFIGNQFMMAAGGLPLLVLTSVIGIWIYHDRRLSPEDVPDQPLVRTVARAYVFNPKSAPDFSWVWLSRLLVTFGIAFTGSFAVYFLTDHLEVSKGDLPSLMSANNVLSMLGALIGTVVGSFVTDRVRSRKPLVMISALMLAAGSVVVAYTPSVPFFFIGSALIALATGFFIPTDGVLVMSVLPGGDKDVAKYMSLFVIADQLPRSIGPMLAPAILALGGMTALGGYPLLYLVGGVIAILGGVVVRQVRAAV
ncbi:MFS transporter [Streptomyces longisporoflavus]|uniref:MFS transporter n=1 Tax=Streptomyces longisporoflavus TaxID=28044 RepID=A0ABW7QZY9_9ACTN